MQNLGHLYSAIECPSLFWRGDLVPVYLTYT